MTVDTDSLRNWLASWGDDPNWADKSGLTVPVTKETFAAMLDGVALEIALQLGVFGRMDVGNGVSDKWAKVGRYLHHIEVDPVMRIVKARP